MDTLYREITACRACHSTRLESVLDMGELCVSDFLRPGEPEVKAPLELIVCLDCSLVQLRHTVDRDRLYKGQYWYRSGTNESMVAALRDVAQAVQVYAPLREGDVVVDLGSNDSTMLRMFPAHARRIGVEPSPMAEEGQAEGLEIIRDYFPPANLADLPKARIICSVAQFYNVADLEAYMEGVKALLAPDGVFCLQMAYLPATLRTHNVGDFVHEHVTFWTLGSLQRLLARYDLGVVSVFYNNVNGGSFRVMVKHGQHGCIAYDDVSKADMVRFAQSVAQLKERTIQFLKWCKSAGNLVVGLGASTKNNTVLDYYGVGPELIPCFAERQTAKVGRFTPTGIPIVSEETARAMRPAYFFLGPWHFLDSLCVRERAYLEAGGQFIVPFPEFRIVDLKEADRLLATRTTEREVPNVACVFP